MTWRTVVVAADRLTALLTRIRAGGGTVISCCPDHGLVTVTWTTPAR